MLIIQHKHSGGWKFTAKVPESYPANHFPSRGETPWRIMDEAGDIIHSHTPHAEAKPTAHTKREGSWAQEEEARRWQA